MLLDWSSFSTIISNRSALKLKQCRFHRSHFKPESTESESNSNAWFVCSLLSETVARKVRTYLKPRHLQHSAAIYTLFLSPTYVVPAARLSVNSLAYRKQWIKTYMCRRNGFLLRNTASFSKHKACTCCIKSLLAIFVARKVRTYMIPRHLQHLAAKKEISK